MKFHDIRYTAKDGDGYRVIIYVAGCTHGCRGCQNPVTWDKDCGANFDALAENELFEKLKKEYVKGVTFSGGDPLHPDNRDEVYRLEQRVKNEFPDKDIWLYTGYTYEEILKDETLKRVVDLCDVLCEGRFILEKRSIDTHWVGSTNQRVIDIPATKGKGNIVLYRDEGRSLYGT